LTEKKPDWIIDTTTSGKPIIVTRMECYYNPETGDTNIKFYNDKEIVRSILLPVQPKEGSAKWEEYHND